MNSSLTFDQSLPFFVQFLLDTVGSKLVQERVFLRDPAGKLSFIVEPGDLPKSTREDLSLSAAEALAPYVDADGFAIATPEELFDDSLRESKGWQETVRLNDRALQVRLIDRRVVGNDWLRSPAELAQIPRIVFASLKGGVGRSTALCVAAAALAQDGLRVLAIDMDVEAPGLGSMLLQKDTYPKYGLLDYLVESTVSELDRHFFSELVAPSWLAQGAGIVSVVPAIGRETLFNPHNVLSKLARAYITDPHENDGLSGRMNTLIERLTESGDYDVVLVDARAGLHETTGAAIGGLGAKVFLFGIDQPQTFSAYSLLLQSLAIVGDHEWLDRLTIVQAKANADFEQQFDFADRFRDLVSTSLFRESIPEQQLDLSAMREVFEISWDDETIEFDDRLLIDDELPVAHIIESEIFRGFDPISNPGHLTADVYRAVYGDFLQHVALAGSFSIGEIYAA